MLSGGTLERNVTHFPKTWKVTVEGIECNNAAFYRHFKKAHTRNCVLSRKKLFSQILHTSWQLDYSRYCQVSLLPLCFHWQTLSRSYFYFCGPKLAMIGSVKIEVYCGCEYVIYSTYLYIDFKIAILDTISENIFMLI